MEASSQKRRKAAFVSDDVVPNPPEALPVRAAVANLRTRLEYVQDMLGLRIELVALLADLSHKALRLYRSEAWNPNLSTLL
jgi:hypothetical protein